MPKLKFLLKFFLFLLILIIFIGLVGLIFFLRQPPDTIIKFTTIESLVYFHFSFDPLYASSYKAARFFQKEWPSQAIDYLFSEKPSWQALKINFSKNFISYLQEMGFVLFQKNEEILPLLIYRFKPVFKNFALVLAGPGAKRVYDYWLSPTVVILSPEKIDFLESNGSFFKNKNFPKPFIGQAWGRVYLNRPKLKTLIKNELDDSWSDNFFKTFSQNEIGYLEILLKRNNLFLKSYPEKNLDQLSFKSDKEFSENIFINFGPNYYLLYNMPIIWQLKNHFILPKIFANFSPQFFLFSQNSFAFFTKKPTDLSTKNLIDILKEDLSYLLPEEKNVVLPDGDSVVELIANPKIFSFEWQNYESFQIAKKKSSHHNIDLGLAQNNDFLLFSQDFKFLKTVLQTIKEKPINLFVKNCWSRKATQSMIFVNEDKGFSIILKIFSNHNVRFLNGCLRLN